MKKLLILLALCPAAFAHKHHCDAHDIAYICGSCALPCLGINKCLNKCVGSVCNNFVDGECKA